MTTPEDLVGQLLEVSSNLQDHIEARAQEIAAPRIQAAEDDAEQKVTDLMARHDAEVRRLEGLIAELRRQIKPLVRQSDELARIRRAEREAAAKEGESKLLAEAAREVINAQGSVSITWIQRRVRVGYAVAQLLIDQLERADIVGIVDARGQRKVLVPRDRLDATLAKLQPTEAEAPT